MDREARIIYGLCIATTTPFIASSMLRYRTIGPGTTICMMIAGLGVLGFVVDWRRRSRLPRARAVRGSSALVPHVLVVDDRAPLRASMAAALTADGHQVIEAATLADARHALTTASPRAVILDVQLPDGSGLELLPVLRERAIPAIVVSAHLAAPDRGHAIEAGAYDVLAKPVAAVDLTARVRAALAAQPPVASTFAVGRLIIDTGTATARYGDRASTLTPEELRALLALARSADRTLTYRQLVEAVWGSDAGDRAAHVRALLVSLRHKLEDDPARPRLLVADLGVGYRLDAR